MRKSPARPGGRSARVRRAVLDAALDCLDEGLAQVSLADVAARAGVAASSLYRRWGTRENLMAEALLDQSLAQIPVPDTGAIRSDLIVFAESVARFLGSRRGATLLRTLAALEWSEELDAARATFWEERFARAVVMVERATERGELGPGTDARLLIEALIAPLHLRVSLLGTAPTADLEQQVDLLLRGTRTGS